MSLIFNLVFRFFWYANIFTVIEDNYKDDSNRKFWDLLKLVLLKLLLILCHRNEATHQHIY